MENKAWTIAVFEFQLARQINVTRHRADPAHFGADDRDRFAINHRFKGDLFDFARFCKLRATRARGVILAELLFGFTNLIGDAAPLQLNAVQKSSSPARSSMSCVALALKFHLFKAAQRAQAHVENGFSLDFG